METSTPAPVAVATALSTRYTLRAPASTAASISARSSTPLMLPGTVSSTRGLKRLKLVTRPMSSRSMATVMS